MANRGILLANIINAKAGEKKPLAFLGFGPGPVATLNAEEWADGQVNATDHGAPVTGGAPTNKQ